MARKRIKIRGKGSYFGGPNDAMNTGTALGVPDTTPGIAVARHDTLGGYYLMKTQGKTFVTRHVDYGPDTARTGRVWDLTEAEVKRQGLKDPTDTKGTLVYLGKNRAKAMALAAKLGAKGSHAGPTQTPAESIAAAVAPQPAAASDLLAQTMGKADLAPLLDSLTGGRKKKVSSPLTQSDSLFKAGLSANSRRV